MAGGRGGYLTSQETAMSGPSSAMRVLGAEGNAHLASLSEVSFALEKVVKIL